MATKESKSGKTPRLSKADKLAAAFKPFKSKLTTAGAAFVELRKRETELKVDLGSLWLSMMSSLATANYPEADRPNAILAAFREVGVHGFSAATIESWGKASHAWNLLAGVKTVNADGSTNDKGPDLRDSLALYTLIDLSRIPSEDEKTGGLVAVAQAANTAGCETDDEYRTFIRERKNAGKKPPKVPTMDDYLKRIADKAMVDRPLFAAVATDDPLADAQYLVDDDDLVAVAMWALSVRETGGTFGPKGSQTLPAYRRFFRNGFSELTTEADTDDRSGATDDPAEVAAS